MGWNDNKAPVKFKRFRWGSTLFSTHRGWFFERGIGEHASITTRELIQLLTEEKAFFVIDDDAWDRLVKRYRGEKAASSKRTEDEQQKALLENLKRQIIEKEDKIRQYNVEIDRRKALKTNDVNERRKLDGQIQELTSQRKKLEAEKKQIAAKGMEIVAAQKKAA